MILSVGTACSNYNDGSATNDSAATIDEVIATTAGETTVVPTTIKATEQQTTEKATEETKTQIEEVSDDKPIDKEPEEESEDSGLNSDVEDNTPNNEQSTSDYSEHEIDLIAKTTYLESGNCGEYCQWLTASTILNLADRSGGIANVVYDYNTFNVAGMIDGCSPSDLSYSVAQRVASGDRDYNVMAFRAGYYHSFGTPYTNVDNVYFSTY